MLIISLILFVLSIITLVNQSIYFRDQRKKCAKYPLDKLRTNIIFEIIQSENNYFKEIE